MAKKIKDKTKEIFLKTAYLSEKQSDFFKNNAINFSTWTGLIIDKAIVINQQGRSIFKILQDSIEETERNDKNDREQQ